MITGSARFCDEILCLCWMTKPAFDLPKLEALIDDTLTLSLTSRCRVPPQTLMIWSFAASSNKPSLLLNSQPQDGPEL